MENTPSTRDDAADATAAPVPGKGALLAWDAQWAHDAAPAAETPGSADSAESAESREASAPVAVTVIRQRAKAGPALVVLGLVAVVALGGAAIAILGSGEKPSGGAPLGRLPGVALSARSAGPIIRRIAMDGNPPQDVTNALVVPATATVVHAVRPPPAVNLYSGTALLAVADSPGEVTTFFQRELRHDHWTILATDSTASGTGTRIIARIPSADGFYWEVGVVVAPTAESITPALGGANAPTSTVSLTVFEVDSAD